MDTSVPQQSQLLAPDDGTDSDSAFGDSVPDTVSLYSEITNRYKYQNGRRYNTYREYWGPNDEQQADSVDVAHASFRMCLDDRLFLAPVDPHIRKAIDFGTGTGIWAMDFADQFPDCQVIATDIDEKLLPREVPPNLEFQIDDIEERPWTFGENELDFAHMRCMYGCVRDWSSVYPNILRSLKPGAYFEQLEVSVVPRSDDGTVGPDSTMALWGRVSLEAGDKYGKTLRVIDEMKDNLIRAGFVDVVERRYKVPLGPWTRDRNMAKLGLLTQAFWLKGLQGYAQYLLHDHLHWNQEEIDIYLAKMRDALKDRRVHAYQELGVVYGRKPF